MCQFCVAKLMRGIELASEIIPLPTHTMIERLVSDAVAQYKGDEYAAMREHVAHASPSYWRDVCAMPTVLFPFNGLVPPNLLMGDPVELKEQYFQACFYREVMREFGTPPRSALIQMN